MGPIIYISAKLIITFAGILVRFVVLGHRLCFNNLNGNMYTFG